MKNSNSYQSLKISIDIGQGANSKSIQRAVIDVKTKYSMDTLPKNLR